MIRFLQRLAKQFTKYRLILSNRNPEQVSAIWEREWSQGEWEFMGQLSEAAHYYAVMGYFLQLKPGGSILDLGCGNGLLLRRLPPDSYSAYLGVDFSPTALAACPREGFPKADFVQADVSQFDTDRRFQTVVINEVLYCLPRPLYQLSRFEKFLAPGGIFIISMVAHPASWLLWRRMKQRYQVLDGVELRSLGKSATWRVLALAPRQG